MRQPDFSLSSHRFRNHNLIATLCPILSLFVSREITVLRQFLGVPPDAHIVGQRFHRHQVGIFFTFFGAYALIFACPCVPLSLYELFLYIVKTLLAVTQEVCTLGMMV